MSAALILAAFTLTACGQKSADVVNPYPEFSGAYYDFQSAATGSEVKTFTSDLCVIGAEDTALTNTHYETCGSAGVFNLSRQEVPFAYQVHERRYPASTTKILTLYIAVTMGNLDDLVIVSDNAVDQPSDASTCDLVAGDRITLRELCYGMFLRSGNDASVAIAEHIGGSIAGFAEIMNQTANSLGATNSHFVNPHGMPDDNHYTTVYDMYLIMNAAVKNQDFLTVFTTDTYTASYSNAAGEPVTKEWTSTNGYLSGKNTAPQGITVLGGKTGTTGAAGYCLINLIQNPAGEYLVSTVYKGDGRSNLYLMMNEIMQYYAPLTE